MTQWRFQANPRASGPDGNDIQGGLQGGGGFSLTEIQSQIKFYTTFTCSDLRVQFTTMTTTSTVTLRDDSVNTDVSVSVTGTGWTEDLTDSAVIASGSLVNLESINGGGMHGDDQTMESSLMTYEHASIDAPILGGGQTGNLGATSYMVMGSGNDTLATESDSRQTFQRATTLSNLRMRVRNSASTPDFDFSPFKNGTASTNLTFNIVDTSTYEDITGSDTYASGDTASFGLVRTTGTMGVGTFQVDVDTPEVWLTIGSDIVSSTRTYAPFTGDTDGTSVEDEYDMRIGSVTAGSLETFIAVAGSGTRDVTLRVGATNSTNLTINVTTTGYLADLTGSESIADDDSMVITAIAPSSNMTVNWAAIECPWTDPSAGAARRVMITSD